MNRQPRKRPLRALRVRAGPPTSFASVRLAAGVAGPTGAVGLRCSPHPAAAALARLARGREVGPLTATSLNRSGEADCYTRADAERLVAGAIPLVEGPDAGGEPPSSVVDATGREPRVLREGAIPRLSIIRVLEASPA